MRSADESIIRAAADVSGLTLTDFIVSAAANHARQTLADQIYFGLSDEKFAEFSAILDRPGITPKPNLARAASMPSVFTSDE